MYSTCVRTPPLPLGQRWSVFVVQAGPASAQSHMIGCQVPEKSNNAKEFPHPLRMTPVTVREESFFWVKHLDIKRSWCVSPDWEWDPGDKHAHAHTGMHRENKLYWCIWHSYHWTCFRNTGTHIHKTGGRFVTGWNLREMTSAVPSLSCRREQKKVTEKRQKEGMNTGLCQVQHPPLCAQLRPGAGVIIFLLHSL